MSTDRFRLGEIFVTYIHSIVLKRVKVRVGITDSRRGRGWRVCVRVNGTLTARQPWTMLAVCMLSGCVMFEDHHQARKAWRQCRRASASSMGKYRFRTEV